MECPLCKGAFLITYTKTKDPVDDEDNYNAFWSKTCVNPWEMVKLMHSDLYHNQCVHDGEDLPLCSELAARIDDDWCFNINKMSSSRNKKYEQEICPSEVAYQMIMYNLKVDLAQFCTTFQCQPEVARQCFAHLGLQNPRFEEQYHLLFGHRQFEKRTKKQGARKRQYASMSHNESDSE